MAGRCVLALIWVEKLGLEVLGGVFQSFTQFEFFRK